MAIVGWWRARSPVPVGDTVRVEPGIYHQHISWWRRRRATEIPGEGPAAPASDHSDAPVAKVAVRGALARLSPRQRAVLVLRYFEDLTESQTAEILGISVGTVESQARDGLARLRVLAPELGALVQTEVGR
jgi:RNA polymerase sigma factor (sigma-70 family)